MCRWVKLLHDEDRVECPFLEMNEPLATYCYYCSIPEIYKIEVKKGEGGENALFKRQEPEMSVV